MGQGVVCYALVVQLLVFTVAGIYSLLTGVTWVLGVVLSPERQSLHRRNGHLNRAASQKKGESFTHFVKTNSVINAKYCCEPVAKQGCEPRSQPSAAITKPSFLYSHCIRKRSS